jgi:hypothetical protein
MNYKIEVTFIERLNCYYINFISDFFSDICFSYSISDKRSIKECFISPDEKTLMTLQQKILYCEV